MSEQINHKVATYMARVAEALEAVPKCDPGFGEFYVSKVEISFDGDETGYAVVADEFGGYSLQFANPTTEPEEGRDA